jgi:hypothetical protein
MKNTGNVYYLDDYGTEYEVQWAPSRSPPGTIDITTITRQPVAWGETYDPNGATGVDRGGYVENFIAYRRGIISTMRQILKVNDAGYEIVSASEEQKIGFFAVQRRKKTAFKHFLDQQYTDQIQAGVSDGACFGDVSEAYTMGTWADPDHVTSMESTLTYIDVWD